MIESVATIRLAGETVPERGPPAGHLPRGTTVGRYVILAHVGEGGMGVVYAAYDSQLDRKVALKLLRPALARDVVAAEIESRLLREAQAMARLNHPNVVAVYDVGLHEHHVFMAMEYVEGETLTKWLRVPHPLRERLEVLRGAGKGLAAAHAAGLVHRDFKPDNVLVGSGGRVVVLDFGIARTDTDVSPDVPLGRPREDRAHEVTGQANDPLSSPLTLAGSILGTIGYMAPEQGLGDATTAATDQFSYAVALYIALYGEKPFPAAELADYLEQVHRPIPPPKVTKGIPPWLRRVVVRGLAADPQERYPTLEAMLAALEADPTILARRVLWAMAVFVLLAATAFFVGRSVFQRELACAYGADAFRPAWDESVRSKVMAAFAKAGADEGAGSAERVAHRFDEFARQWVAMRSEVCRATRVERKQSEEVFRLRNDCLDRELTAARSLSKLLEEADLAVVKKATEIAYGLPQLSWCADVSTLRASSGLPDDPEKRARVNDVRAKIAEAESNWLAGRVKLAQAAADVALAMARPIGHGPTTAEAMFVAGRDLQRQGEFAAAYPLLREATLTASRAGADSLVVRAAGELAFVSGPELQHADEARIWLDIARVSLDRMGGNEELLIEVMRAESAIAEEVDLHPEVAVAMGEKVVDASRRIFGAHPKTALAVYNLGNSYATLGDPVRARPLLEEALSTAEAVGGASYPLLGWSEQMLGQTLGELGETARAKDLLRQALRIFESNGLYSDSALALERLAAIAESEGDAKGAMANAERAFSSMMLANSPGYLVPMVNVTLAEVRLRAGAPDVAPLCDQALAEQEDAKAIDPGKTYGWDALRCKAETYMAIGQNADAIPILERSLTVGRRTFRGDYARTQFALARALLATRSDIDRSYGLADQARREFAKYPFLAFDLSLVDAWLAKHPRG